MSVGISVLRHPGLRGPRLGVGLLGLTLVLARPAAAQGFLERFSYEGLRLTGIGVEVGAVVSDRLATDVIGSLRVDYGFFAPRVRALFGVSYFRSRFDDAEITELNTRLAGVVVASGPFSIDVGTITQTEVALDLDLQVLLTTGPNVIPYLGLGFGVHVRDADGAAIDDTFVEDALQTVAAAVNVSGGLEFALTRHLWLTSDVRGILSSGLLAATFRGGLKLRFRGTS